MSPIWAVYAPSLVAELYLTSARPAARTCFACCGCTWQGFGTRQSVVLLLLRGLYEVAMGLKMCPTLGGVVSETRCLQFSSLPVVKALNGRTCSLHSHLRDSAARTADTLVCEVGSPFPQGRNHLEWCQCLPGMFARLGGQNRSYFGGIVFGIYSFVCFHFP